MRCLLLLSSVHKRTGAHFMSVILIYKLEIIFLKLENNLSHSTESKTGESPVDWWKGENVLEVPTTRQLPWPLQCFVCLSSLYILKDT